MAQTDLVSSSSSELGHGLRPITRTHPRTRQAGRRRLIRSLCMLIAIALGGVVVALCTYLETGRALFICPKCGAQKSEFMLAFANRKLLTWSRPEHSDALDFLHREIPPHECEWQPLRLAGFAAKSFTGVGTRIGRAFLDWTPVFGAAFLQGAPLPSQEARVLFPMTGCILMAARPLKYVPELAADRLYPDCPRWNALWLLHELSCQDVRTVEMHWPDFRTAIVADIVLCPDTRLGEYRAALVLYAKKRLSADVIEVIRDHWDCVNWDIVNPPIEEFRRTMPKAHELDPERDQSLLIWDPHGC